MQPGISDRREAGQRPRAAERPAQERHAQEAFAASVGTASRRLQTGEEAGDGRPATRVKPWRLEARVVGRLIGARFFGAWVFGARSIGARVVRAWLFGGTFFGAKSMGVGSGGARSGGPRSGGARSGGARTFNAQIFNARIANARIVDAWTTARERSAAVARSAFGLAAATGAVLGGLALAAWLVTLAVPGPVGYETNGLEPGAVETVGVEATVLEMHGSRSAAVPSAWVPSAWVLAAASLAVAFLSGAGALAVGASVIGTRRRGARAAELEALHRQVEKLDDMVWELRESDARHRSVINALGDVIFRRDRAGRIVYANEAFGRCFGLDLTAATGRPFVLPRADAPATTEADLPGSGDLALETAAGRRWFSRLDVPVRDGAGQPVVQTILRDVTPRREAEEALVEARDQAQSASQAKSRFLATVSHEIRTPLNGILGMGTLLGDTRLTAEQESYVEAIATSGEALLALIDEVLDFSRIEAGRLELRPVPTKLELLAERVVELLAPRAQAKGLEIACYVAPEVPDEVLVDATRLRQVLINLAGNGIKFTDAGGVLIEILAEAGGARPGRPVRLQARVHDTGIGLSREAAARLFTEFEQVDHGPARRHGGTGLGLAISQRIVEAMNGRIAIESEPGAGATFVFGFDAVTRTPASAAAPPASFAGRRVGLVCGEGIAATLTSRRLRELSLDVCDMGNDPGAAACDIVVVDHAETADPAGWLNAARAAGLTAPAAILVTPKQRGSLPVLRSAGYAAYLVKPVRSISLIRVTAALLAGRPVGETEAGWPEAVANDAAAGIAPLRVLVVEDNDINLMLTVALLKKHGHEVTTARDGESALAAVEASYAAGAEPFHAVFMDLHMPGLDGAEAMRRIRAAEQACDRPRLPIFALTADIMPASRAEAEAAGADRFLTKPLEPDALSETLAEIG